MIRPTLFNNLYLILDVLLPSTQTARILRDPSGFACSQEETLRAAWQLIRHSAAVDAPECTGVNGTGGPATAVKRRRRDRVPSRILLR